MIDRPDIEFNPGNHTYKLDGERVPGVSSIAKIGTDGFTPGAWWGFGIAVEGLVELGRRFDSVKDARGALYRAKRTPNQVRDAGGKRGSSVHDALELLAQENTIPDPADFPEGERGHVLSLVRWYLHFRPSFIATEVMVGSREHRFAGRYDIRCLIAAPSVWSAAPSAPLGLCLVDLKTSKRVYPEQHFPQLEGYELASVEMGFPPSDGRFVLRTSPDGSFTPEENFVRSWATGEDFLAYLAAYRAVKRIEKADPTRKRRK